jgi:hypothetical protein
MQGINLAAEMHKGVTDHDLDHGQRRYGHRRW